MPGTAGVTSGRHASTANTYEMTSTNMDFHGYDKQTPLMNRRTYDMPSEGGQRGVDDIISDSALHAQFAQPYDSSQAGARGQVNKTFAATMNAKQSNNFGTNGGQMTSLVKSPQ